MSWKRRLVLTVASLSVAILLLAGLRLMHADAQPTTPPIEPAKADPAPVPHPHARAPGEPAMPKKGGDGPHEFDPSKAKFDPKRSVLDPAKTPVDPSKLSVFDPSKPPAFDPSKPPVFDPSKATAIDPTKPPVFDPGKPAAIDPTKPPAFDPSKPAAIDPSKPPVFDPSKPAAIDPSKEPVNPSKLDPASPIRPKAPEPFDPNAATGPLPSDPAKPSPASPAFDPSSPPSVGQMPSTPPVSPNVKTWDLKSYRCQGDETSFDQVSKRLYGNEKYGRALWLLNCDWNPALRRAAPRFESGQSLVYPPLDVLVAKYAIAIGHAEPETKTPAQEFYWTLQVDSVGGKTSLTAKAKNNEVVLNVVCDTLDMQSPRGKVVAQGSVKITGPHLTAKADKLTINFHDDSVLLEGQAEVKHKQNSRGLELKAERLALRVQASETKVVQPTVNYEYEFVPREVPAKAPPSCPTPKCPN